MWEANPNLKILYVDLDAYQGNGVELTFEGEMQEGKFVVFDVYGVPNYPRDIDSINMRAKIKYNHPLKIRAQPIDDQNYLGILRDNLPTAIEETKPGLIFYNAGTDVYERDPLGGMGVTAEGIKERDAFVFSQAKENRVPIVMTLSGGYSPESAAIIGASIENIVNNVMKKQ